MRRGVYTRTAEAATLLRDLVYTAWLESESTARAGGTEMIQPTSPRHPQYNPSTGSAPAPWRGGR